MSPLSWYGDAVSMSWLENESVLIRIKVIPIISEADPDLEFTLDDKDIYVQVFDAHTRELVLSKSKTSPSDSDIGVDFENGEHLIRIIITPAEYTTFVTGDEAKRLFEFCVLLRNTAGENYSVFPHTNPANKKNVHCIIDLGRQEITIA